MNFNFRNTVLGDHWCPSVRKIIHTLVLDSFTNHNHYGSILSIGRPSKFNFLSDCAIEEMLGRSTQHKPNTLAKILQGSFGFVFYPQDTGTWQAPSGPWSHEHTKVSTIKCEANTCAPQQSLAKTGSTAHPSQAQQQICNTMAEKRQDGDAVAAFKVQNSLDF